MNIFILDQDPHDASRMLADRHCVKMILEQIQILCTTHRFVDGKQTEVITKTGRKKKEWQLEDAFLDGIYYSTTHINHPCTIWARESCGNYTWLYNYTMAIGDEYTYRYGKQHLSIQKLGRLLATPPKNLSMGGMTPFVCAMDSKYIISNDPVVNYRNYYNKGKRHLFNWKNRPVPDWIEKEEHVQ